MKRGRGPSDIDDERPSKAARTEEYVRAVELLPELLQEILDRESPLALGKHLGADPSYLRPDGILTANRAWFAACCRDFQRHWPPPGHPYHQALENCISMYGTPLEEGVFTRAAIAWQDDDAGKALPTSGLRAHYARRRLYLEMWEARHRWAEIYQALSAVVAAQIHMFAHGAMELRFKPQLGHFLVDPEDDAAFAAHVPPFRASFGADTGEAEGREEIGDPGNVSGPALSFRGVGNKGPWTWTFNDPMSELEDDGTVPWIGQFFARLKHLHHDDVVAASSLAKHTAVLHTVERPVFDVELYCDWPGAQAVLATGVLPMPGQDYDDPPQRLLLRTAQGLPLVEIDVTHISRRGVSVALFYLSNEHRQLHSMGLSTRFQANLWRVDLSNVNDALQATAPAAFVDWRLPTLFARMNADNFDVPLFNALHLTRRVLLKSLYEDVMLLPMAQIGIVPRLVPTVAFDIFALTYWGSKPRNVDDDVTVYSVEFTTGFQAQSTARNVTISAAAFEAYIRHVIAFSRLTSRDPDTAGARVFFRADVY